MDERLPVCSELCYSESMTTSTASTFHLVVRCERYGHLTSTEVLHAEVHADGSVHGLCGSDADYCQVCDSHVSTVGVCTSDELDAVMMEQASVLDGEVEA